MLNTTLYFGTIDFKQDIKHKFSSENLIAQCIQKYCQSLHSSFAVRQGTFSELPSPLGNIYDSPVPAYPQRKLHSLKVKATIRPKYHL